MLQNIFEKHKITAAIFLACLASAILLFYPKTPEMTVTFLDVGQGDCTVIRTPAGKTIMIDGGGVPETDDRKFDVGAKIVLPYLRGQGINSIDLMIASHPHEDHISGLISVMKEMNVLSVLDSGIPDETEPYMEFRNLIKQRRIPYYTGRSSTVVKLDNRITMTILHPTKGIRQEDCNDSSLIIRLKYRKVSALFTGDCGQEIEEMLCRTKCELRSTVLKVGHHGSASSTGYLWLRRVNPQVAVISAGKDNLFGHPSRAVLQRLKTSHCSVYRTDRDGAVIMRTDGRSIRVSHFRRSK